LRISLAFFRPAPLFRMQGMRFRLRTLFVVIALLALALWWLVHEWHIVELRRSVLAQVVDRPGAYAVSADESTVHGRVPNIPQLLIDLDISSVRRKYPPPGVPFVRRWMGDQAIRVIWCPEESPADRERIHALFPEATLRDAGTLQPPH
jgi:hypothetical protein